MEFLPSKEIAHADELSRLIPKNTELLEWSVIASLKSEMDVKYVLIQYNQRTTSCSRRDRI